MIRLQTVPDCGSIQTFGKKTGPCVTTRCKTGTALLGGRVMVRMPSVPGFPIVTRSPSSKELFLFPEPVMESVGIVHANPKAKETCKGVVAEGHGVYALAITGRRAQRTVKARSSGDYRVRHWRQAGGSLELGPQAATHPAYRGKLRKVGLVRNTRLASVSRSSVRMAFSKSAKGAVQHLLPVPWRNYWTRPPGTGTDGIYKRQASVIVTDKWIMANVTERGAWKAKQLAAIGVSWPPREGWKQRAIGKTITPDQQGIFESFAGKVGGAITGRNYKPFSCVCEVPPWEYCECPEQREWLAANDLPDEFSMIHLPEDQASHMREILQS